MLIDTPYIYMNICVLLCVLCVGEELSIPGAGAAFTDHYEGQHIRVQSLWEEGQQDHLHRRQDPI